ncbi:MAG: hypothetical protein J1E28_01445 [Helicobacter sp.]|uniref:hypothetical protein n=1 Tax=Helicobacter sp. TaxID=218 RepID=UPI0025C28BB7|nr:hypothetical protein [Helicobacter sp.]MCH5313051.1 hypothetical protein [Helicobacter sp.]
MNIQDERRDLKPLKAFLLRHGHTEQELEKLDRESVIKLYEKSTREETLGFLHYMNKDEFVVSSLDEADINDFKVKVQENLHDTLLLIGIIRDAFSDFSYSDIVDTLTLNIRNFSARKMQRILRIAYHEFQEILLHQISIQLKNLPIEEYKTIMNYYEKKRNDIARLQSTITKLSSDVKREQILDMAHLKLLIVKNFMPKDIFNDTYREYLNNTPEKLALVSEVLSLTGMYSKNYLKNLPIEELEEIREKMLEDKKQDEHNQKIYNYYVQMLDEAMFGADEQEFSEVCTKICTNLNQKLILMISEYMNTKNPVYSTRFNSFVRDFKANIK